MRLDLIPVRIRVVLASVDLQQVVTIGFDVACLTAWLVLASDAWHISRGFHAVLRASWNRRSVRTAGKVTRLLPFAVLGGMPFRVFRLFWLAVLVGGLFGLVTTPGLR